MNGREAAEQLRAALGAGLHDAALLAALDVGEAALQGYRPRLSPATLDAARDKLLYWTLRALADGRLAAAATQGRCSPGGLVARQARWSILAAHRAVALREAREARYVAAQLDNPPPEAVEYRGRGRARRWLG